MTSNLKAESAYLVEPFANQLNKSNFLTTYGIIAPNEQNSFLVMNPTGKNVFLYGNMRILKFATQKNEVL